MGHAALPGQVQGNELLVAQVTHSGNSKLKFGLQQRKMILDIQNGKGISVLPHGYRTLLIHEDHFTRHCKIMVSNAAVCVRGPGFESQPGNWPI